MKDYAGLSKQKTLGLCHEMVEEELRGDIRSFLVTNYRRLMRGNWRMVKNSVEGLSAQLFRNA